MLAPKSIKQGLQNTCPHDVTWSGGKTNNQKGFDKKETDTSYKRKWRPNGAHTTQKTIEMNILL